MQAYMETIFDLFYLTSVISLGYIMLRNNKGNKKIKLFGTMAILLGGGDAFHLLPRSYALFTGGLEAHAASLGLGKMITSITMTVFYLILYRIFLKHYKVKENRNLSYLLYFMAFLRIGLCLMPQNQWLSYHSPLNWGVYRNIPFLFIGLILIYLFAGERKEDNFKNMALSVTLSFLFYIPVVLWAKAFPLVGILMIPKTLAYLYIVVMGYREYLSISKGQLKEAD